MTYKDLPLYNIVLNPESEEEGLSVISIVDNPAVCEQLFCFSKEERKQFIFADETNEKHCITSVALLADCPIYRVDGYGNGYYVVFQKQTIRDLVEKYSKDGYNNLVSFQHNGEIVNDFIMLESYFVDKEKGIAPTQFDVPDGSWMVTYKCTNDETWEMVKNELATGGYSVEITCDIEPAKDGQQIYDEPESKIEDPTDEEFMNWLEELLKALEDADYDVEFENSKKKVELSSEDDEDEDGLWSLNFEEVERSDIAKLVNKGVKINKVDYWVYGIGKDNGTDAAILYDPNKEKYVVMPLKDIKQFLPLKEKAGNFPPLPNDIVDNDEITVQKTVVSNEIPSIMHNHILAELSYNDELPNPHTGYRQVAIVAEGVTKANNHCFRAYELFGDSRSAAEGELPLPSWRLFLTKRVKSLKAMVGTEPYTREWLNSLAPNYNWNDDRSMAPCTDHITWDEFNN
jgi:hypothetical protein